MPPAVDALREWSVLQQVKAPYRCFAATFVLGSLLIAAAIVVSAAVASTAAVITTPTTVAVSVADGARAGFTSATGCTSPQGSSFTAVGGTWERPTLEVDGAGCAFAARWTPGPAEAEVRLPAKQ